MLIINDLKGSCEHDGGTPVNTVELRGKNRVRSNREPAFTLIEVMFAIMIVGMLTALAAPSFLNARQKSRKNICIENLRQMDSAVQQWAFENSVAPQNSYAFTNTAILKFLKGSQLPLCPAGGVYEAGMTIGASPSCTVSGHALGSF